MKREIKFYIFSLLMTLAIKFIPKDAKKTWEWVSKMPIQD